MIRSMDKGNKTVIILIIRDSSETKIIDNIDDNYKNFNQIKNEIDKFI